MAVFFRHRAIGSVGSPFGRLRRYLIDSSRLISKRRDDGVADLLGVHLPGAGGTAEDVSGAEVGVDDFFLYGGFDLEGFFFKTEKNATKKMPGI